MHTTALELCIIDSLTGSQDISTLLLVKGLPVTEFLVKIKSVRVVTVKSVASLFYK